MGSNPTVATYSKKLKLYSIEEAESLIPELKSILKDIREKGKEYTKCLIDSAQLVINFRNNPYDTEGVLDRTIKTRKELRELFNNLEKYGVILRDIDKGGVDFPAEVDGEEVMLCWRAFEESKISYWHTKDETCTMRKPLKR